MPIGVKSGINNKRKGVHQNTKIINILKTEMVSIVVRSLWMFLEDFEKVLNMGL